MTVLVFANNCTGLLDLEEDEQSSNHQETSSFQDYQKVTDATKNKKRNLCYFGRNCFMCSG